jgi:hypothetical protein
MAASKGPATKQDFEVRIGRDVFLNFNIKDENGQPFSQLANKIAVWSYGLKKDDPLLTRRSDDTTNPASIVDAEFRVVVPILASDTIGKTPSSPSEVYWHELMLIDADGRKVNTTEGKIFLVEASSN